MTQPSPTSLPTEIPDSFFSDLAPSGGGPSEGRELLANLGTPVPAGVWQPNKILPWYDAIIDDMFAFPGCTMKETAARLSRSAVTIGLVVRSDLFKARYSQRRAAYNDEIQHRLTGKMVKVAEAALDHTLTALGKKQDSVPLPILREITTDILDRLGYNPKPVSNPTVAVQVNTGGGDSSVQVSPSALAEAREKLRQVEQGNASAASPAPSGGGSGPVLEGSIVGAP